MKRRAFTLLELVVLVFIAVVLAAIVLPALSRSRATGHPPSCVSVLKHLGVSYAFYLDENGDQYPDFATSGECLYVLYDLDYVDGVEMFRCPKDEAVEIEIDRAQHTILGASYAQDAAPTPSAGIPFEPNSARVICGDRSPAFHWEDTCGLLFADSHAGWAEVDPATGWVANPLLPEDDTRVYVDEPGTPDSQKLDASIDNDSPNPDA